MVFALILVTTTHGLTRPKMSPFLAPGIEECFGIGRSARWRSLVVRVLRNGASSGAVPSLARLAELRIASNVDLTLGANPYEGLSYGPLCTANRCATCGRSGRHVPRSGTEIGRPDRPRAEAGHDIAHDRAVRQRHYRF